MGQTNTNGWVGKYVICGCLNKSWNCFENSGLSECHFFFTLGGSIG